jgi:signal peptidase II
VFGLGLDQTVKKISLAQLEPGEPINLVGDLFRLNLIWNPGAAFGMGADATIFFTIFAIIATVACLVVGLPRITRLWHAIALGMLLAGITGNLVDRFTQPPSPLRGHVVDMFQLKYFAIFNVADVFITAAAALILLGSFFPDEAADEPAEERAPA